MIREIKGSSEIDCAVQLMMKAFPHAYSDIEETREELVELSKSCLLGFYDKGKLVGMIGGMPQYGETGWELHPLCVKKDVQKKGIGRQLMHAFESHVKQLGGCIVYLGTDDEHFRTSLSEDVDLFDNPFYHIENIKNYLDHPFSFYQKVGYTIVGIIPDANGPRKPDIIMAKRLD